MHKFGIIVPLRPAVSSKNWEIESALLKQTIESVLNQSYTVFKVYVIYTNQPLAQVEDERLQYIQYPNKFQSFGEIEEKENLLFLFKSEKLVVARWDKARKIMYGCELAKGDNCTFIMSLDSDDLLSNKLLAYCAQEATKKNCAGWYAEKGFIYQQGTNYLLRVPKMMRFINGSTHILNAGLISLPQPGSTNWQDYNLFTDHGWIKQRVKESNQAILEPVPFPFVTYVVHESNISKIKTEFGFQFRKIVKRIIRSVWLTKKRKAEFQIQISNK